MVAECIRVVRGKKHNGVVQVALALEDLHDLAQLLVDHRHVRRVVAPHPQEVGRRGPVAPRNRVVVVADHVRAQLGLRPRLQRLLLLGELRHRDVGVLIALQVARRGVVRRVRPRKPDLQEQRVGRLALFQPPQHMVADEIVGMQRVGKVPRERAHCRLVRGKVGRGAAVARRLLQLVGVERLVPFVVERAVVLVEEQRAVLVLHNEALVKAAEVVVRVDVHLADVRAVVSGRSQPLDPGRLPRLEVLEHSRRVGIHAGKQARPGSDAHWGGHEAIRECRSLPDHPVEVRGMHPRRAQGIDRVRALLVGHDQDDVRLCVHSEVQCQPAENPPSTKIVWPVM